MRTYNSQLRTLMKTHELGLYDIAIMIHRSTTTIEQYRKGHSYFPVELFELLEYKIKYEMPKPTHLQILKQCKEHDDIL